MRFRLYACLISFVFIFSTSFPVSLASVSGVVAFVQTTTCPNFLPSRLVVGQNGQVTPGDSNNVRSEPGKNGAKIGQIPGEGVFQVLEGPTCADDTAWWKVDYNGLIGWTVEGLNGEYFLEPVDASVASSNETTNSFPEVTDTGITCVSAFTIGDIGEVTEEETVLYASEGAGSEPLMELAIGDQVEVLGTPYCEEPEHPYHYYDIFYVWTPVRFEEREGWIIETTGYVQECENCDGIGFVSSIRHPLAAITVTEKTLTPDLLVIPSPDAITNTNTASLTLSQTVGDGYIQKYAWSPDSQSIAILTTREVVVYDVHQMNTPVHTLTDFAGVVEDVLYTADNQYLITADSKGNIAFWDTISFESQFTLTQEMGNVEFPFVDLALSPDGTRLVIAGGVAGIMIWDMQNPAEPTLVRQISDSTWSVNFLPDGKHFIGGDNQQVTIYDSGDEPSTAQNLYTVSPGDSIIMWVLSDGGHTVGILRSEIWIGGGGSGKIDYLLGEWDTTTGEFIDGQTISNDIQGAGVIDVFPSNHGWIVTLPDGSYPYVYSQRSYYLKEQFGLTDATAFAQSPEGDLDIFGTSTGGLWLIRHRDDSILEVLYGINGQVRDISFSPDGQLIAARGSDNSLRVWDRASRQRLGSVVRHEVSGAFFITGDEQTALIGGRLWNLTTGTRGDRIKDYSDYYRPVLNPSDQLVYKPYEQNRYIWRDLVDSTPDDTSDYAFFYDYASDQRINTFSLDSWYAVIEHNIYDWNEIEAPITVVDLRTNTEVFRIENTFDSFFNAAFSPNNRLLMLHYSLRYPDYQGKIAVVDLSSKEWILDIPLDNYIPFAAFSPDNTQLFLVANTSLDNKDPVTLHFQRYDFTTRTLVDLRQITLYNLSNITVNADGTLLAFGDASGTVYLWDAVEGGVLHQFQAHTGNILQVTFSYDGNKLYTTGSEGTMHIWTTSS